MMISLLIATYNRSHLLAELLKSVIDLRIPLTLNWEILIVDNNSDDHTRFVCRRFAERLPLHYYFEPIQGKTRALNRGLTKARGEFILFCDDDVLLDRDWLAAYAATAEQSEALWFGGRVASYWPGGKPPWVDPVLIDSLSGVLAFHDLGVDSRPYAEPDPLPIGASMMLHRSLLDKVGRFRTDLGPHGRRRGTADDTELIQRAIDAGHRGYYVADALCRHRVPPERVTIPAFYRYGFAKGVNAAKLEPGGPRWRHLSGGLAHAVRGLLMLARHKPGWARLCALNLGYEIASAWSRRPLQRNAK